MLIEDGKGDGNIALVNDDNQLLTKAVSLSEFAYAARNGDAYAWTAVTSDIGTGDTALAVKNNSRSRKLHITKVYAWADAPVIFKIHTPIPCTFSGGDEITAVPLNRSIIKAADAQGYDDEEGTTFADANVIAAMHTNENTDDQHGVVWDFEGAIVLGYADIIAVDVIGETTAYNCTIMGYYKD